MDSLRVSPKMRATWQRVDRANLPQPLYAPAWPGAPGCRAEWGLLLERVVELHNEGKMDGFITTGKRWPAQANVFPPLRDIWEQNAGAIRHDQAITDAWQEYREHYESAEQEEVRRAREEAAVSEQALEAQEVRCLRSHPLPSHTP